MKSHMVLFWPIPQEATKDPKLNRSALCVLGFLTSFWWTTGRAFPSLAAIQERCRMSRRTVLRSLALLESQDWIRRSRRGAQQSSDYSPGRKFTQEEVVPRLAPGAKNGTRSRSTTARAAEDVEAAIEFPSFSDEFRDEHDRLKPRPGRSPHPWGSQCEPERRTLP